SADFGVLFIHGLCDVEVELLPCWDSDVKAITFDGLEDLLGVSVENALRAHEWCILQPRNCKGPEAGGACFGEAGGGSLGKGAADDFTFGRLAGLGRFPAHSAL